MMDAPLSRIGYLCLVRKSGRNARLLPTLLAFANPISRWKPVQIDVAVARRVDRSCTSAGRRKFATPYCFCWCRYRNSLSLSRSILQGATNADCVVMLKQTVYVWRLRPGNAPPTIRFQVPFCNTQRAMEIADMRRTDAARSLC
jgi:hypothetical protein